MAAFIPGASPPLVITAIVLIERFKDSSVAECRIADGENGSVTDLLLRGLCASLAVCYS
jgi:hypothetical protein